MTMARTIKRFLTAKDGAATLEYVILFLPLVAMVFTCFQIALAYHFALTSQKAVENGARIAAVRSPVANDLPTINVAQSGAETGDRCALPGSCVDPGGPWVCTFADLDASCDREAFDDVFQEVAALAYLLSPEDLEVTYRYADLGFANGPFVPIVEVTIVERPFFLQIGFSLYYGPDATDDNVADVKRLPAATATAIAEDMSSTN